MIKANRSSILEPLRFGGQVDAVSSDPSRPRPTPTIEDALPAASGTCVAPAAAEPQAGPSARQPLRGILKSVTNLHLATDGDGNEQQYWPAISEQFPNYERFWQHLVVPMTKRIDMPPGSAGRHERRDNIADDLWNVSYINYSVFLNLVGAFEHLSQPVMLSAGNFYTHLASACDLTEEFLLRVHLLIAECRGEHVPELDPDTKDEFLNKLDRWYDKEYAKAYEHHHRKGNAMIVRLAPRDKILCKYHERQDQAWKEYKRFSRPIREYRNKVVHDVQLGTIRVGKINLMPRIDKIQKYAAIAAPQDALKNPDILKADFVVREEQMFSDFRTFKTCLNALWEKPTADLRSLLYADRNPALLNKYALTRAAKDGLEPGNKRVGNPERPDA